MKRWWYTQCLRHYERKARFLMYKSLHVNDQSKRVFKKLQQLHS